MYQRQIVLLALIVIFSIANCSKPAQKPPEQNQPVTQKTDDAQERRKFHDELVSYLEHEDFTRLEKIAQEITTKKLRFPGGDWKLVRFYEDVGYPPGGFYPEKVDWKSRLEKLEKWSLRYPDSIYANVALAEGQIGYAWHLRGSGFAPTVDETESANFSEWLQRAERTLSKMSDRRKECMAWYRAMESVGLGLGHNKQAMTALVQEAITVEPLYWDVYEGYALYLLPRWYGAPGEWEQFAEESSRKLDEVEGTILYSEICWQMSGFYGPVEFFKENNVSWKKMKSGFMAREKRYGNSIRYMNAFALMAGSARDKLTTRLLMKRIGDRWEPDFWKEKKYFDGYRDWANQ